MADDAPIFAEASSAGAQTPKKSKATCTTKTGLKVKLDSPFQAMIDHVAQSVRDTASSSSGPVSTLDKLKEERKEAKKKSAEKTKELRNYTKRVQRLQKRASKLSDDGLLLEFARRQAQKDKKEKTKRDA